MYSRISVFIVGPQPVDTSAQQVSTNTNTPTLTMRIAEHLG